MKKIFLLFGAMALACTLQAKTLSLDWSKPLNPESFEYDENGTWAGTYNEEDYFTIDFNGMSFAHNAIVDWDFWYGFSVAKSSDTTFADLKDQFRCVAGGGLAGKGTPYILAYAAEGMAATSPCEVYFTSGEAWTAQEAYLCIGSYALDNVLKGGGVARKFAAGDSLVVIVEGLDEDGNVIEGKQVTFFLADYRSENEADWKLNNGWEKCDLSSLGEVYGLIFTMKSSDMSNGYANTGLYFALDGLKISRPTKAGTFENEEGGINVAKVDTCWQGADAPQEGWNNWKSAEFTFQTYYGGNSGYGDYYSAFTVSSETSNSSTGYLEPYRSASGGAYEGQNFAVWNMNYYGADTIKFDTQIIPGFFVNNNAYAVASMVYGDSFAKRFGADDFFTLTCIGVKDGVEAGKVTVDLAKNGEYIVDWTYVDLSSLGMIDGLTFAMNSSDASEWGMNTPAYFCMDNFGAEKPEGYVEPARAKFPETVAIEFTSATSENIRWDDETADPKTGWWQIMAWDDTYYLSFSNAGTIAQAAGTYTLDDLDEEFSYLYLIDGEEETRIALTEVKITVSISEEGVVRVTGYALSADNKYYAINIEYSAPTAAQTVNVSIPDAKLIDTYASSGLYGIYGISAEQIYVQLAVWANDLSGDFTEKDLDNQYLGSGVITDQKQHAIYTATIKVVPGNAEGAYKLTADLLCYNNTLYKVEMTVPGVDAVETIISEMKAQKVIVNGQLLIISDGKTFNIQGVQL